MNLKSIETVLTPPPRHWVGNGFHVHGMIPGTLPMERLNPFVMMDLNPLEVRKGSTTERGVGAHPHKGFETVTIAFAGSIEHHDSLGNHDIIRPGDVQWMTAGSGVLHTEYLEKEFNKKGGEFSMVQLWVNLPQKYKLTPPRYQAISKDDIVTVKPQKGVQTRIIAGDIEGKTGPAKTFSNIVLATYEIKKSHAHTITVPSGDNSALVSIAGELTIEGKTINPNQVVVFEQKGEHICINANTDATFLLMSATPLQEPLAWYGPFVMNTKQEIIEAIEEFNSGAFGQL